MKPIVATRASHLLSLRTALYYLKQRATPKTPRSTYTDSTLIIVAWCSIVYSCIHYQSVLSSEGETHKRQQNAFFVSSSRRHQLHRADHRATSIALDCQKTHFCQGKFRNYLAKSQIISKIS